MLFCTQQDVERALGGSEVLVELLDKNLDGIADADAVAEDSSNGEACHAGEDYNCRCVASPVLPDDLSVIVPN